MLIVLGRYKKNNNGTTMNLTGVAAQHITGTKLVEYTNKDLHSHETTDTTQYIDHTINNTRKVVRDILVVNADPTR